MFVLSVGFASSGESAEAAKGRWAFIPLSFFIGGDPKNSGCAGFVTQTSPASAYHLGYSSFAPPSSPIEKFSNSSRGVKLVE
jgi:hypothetical protein